MRAVIAVLMYWYEPVYRIVPLLFGLYFVLMPYCGDSDRLLGLAIICVTLHYAIKQIRREDAKGVRP